MDSMILDGYCNEHGEPFADVKINIGSMLNHSFNYPNCKVVQIKHHGKIRVVLVTICDIAAGQELTWSYSTDKKGQEEWFLTS